MLGRATRMRKDSVLTKSKFTDLMSGPFKQVGRTLDVNINYWKWACRLV